MAANSVYSRGLALLGWPVWSMTRPRQIAAPAIKRLLAKRRQRSAPANDDGGSASVDLGARMT